MMLRVLWRVMHLLNPAKTLRSADQRLSSVSCQIMTVLHNELMGHPRPLPVAFPVHSGFA